MKFAFENKQIGMRFLVLLAVDLIIFYICYLNFKIKLFVNYPLIYWPGFIIIAILAFINFRELTKWVRGIEGVGEVSDVLRTLPSEFYFVNDVIVGNIGNIDSVVLGPTGIWTLEVKNYRGKVKFESNNYEIVLGRKTMERNFLDQAWSEKRALVEYLKDKFNKEFSVEPILVFSNNQSKINFGFGQQRGVYVINKCNLKELLTKKSHEFVNPELLEKIYQNLLSLKG